MYRRIDNMKKYKTFIPYILILALVVYITFTHLGNNPQNIIAVTGATPKAIVAPIPDNITLTVKGCTTKVYTFNNRELEALASSYLFTREISDEGTYLGAYRYHGIPIINILDGIKIKKPADAAFDGPHDIIVQFKSRKGKISKCSYGELVMSKNMFNYILAYKREPIQPAKEGDSYTKNLYKKDIKGLKLVIACDIDTTRYLDDVIEINLLLPNYDDSLLPETKKGKSCLATRVVCISQGKPHTADFLHVQPQAVSNWIQVGHGRGYKGISNAKGFNLKYFLVKNFSPIPHDAWFLFVGCDGYRCVFSYQEIFEHDSGNKLLIATHINGKPAQGNYMLASTDDFFVDRCVWGLSHILLFK